jgi:hypothetical protein
MKFTQPPSLKREVNCWTVSISIETSTWTEWVHQSIPSYGRIQCCVFYPTLVSHSGVTLRLGCLLPLVMQTRERIEQMWTCLAHKL